ncbi:DUF1622 domain-containing protein [Methylicorpusculum sp.]|uniref:DUF1622 domain-containing protein n=1 Tax=Methylicorpusculum sp. TaxID=2713644 RepID=UPI002ABA4F0C|nr:DUF1622 domain-containing protein [Methylicorpusculum sp.]MDZ4154050.1 DUF1622 domain-containing protein [Methylicorpusculum sp.]
MNATLINEVLQVIRAFVGFIGVIVIFCGALRGLYQFFMFIVSQKFDTNYIRLQLGRSIILGLEFIVGADIIGSLVSPNYYTLGLLGIIVVIRIILSFFLSRELQELSPGTRGDLKGI